MKKGFTQMAKDHVRKKITMHLLKGCAFILLLAVFVFILRSMDLVKINIKDNSAIIPKTVNCAPPTSSFSAPSVPHGFCTFMPLSPADTEEERLISSSIAWPQTPPVTSPLLFKSTSDPAHSIFTILPMRGEGEWHVGDQLDVEIKIFDFQGLPKRSGGDFIVARLHNKELEAGVAGRVVDHLNGSYSAVFPLPWEGSAQVEVTLIHPSEAVTVLRKLNTEHPDRVIFRSVFRSGSVSETTYCNVCLRQTDQPQCNYTDLHTGDPWFCYKPKSLGCDARINHMKSGYKSVLKAGENLLFQCKINLKVLIRASGPAGITVLPQKKGQPSVNQGNEKIELSGFYYHGLWRSLRGPQVRQFDNSSSISQCLKGKIVHMYGDSTTRQWFEYLQASLPGAKTVNLNSPKQAGPYMIWDDANKILVMYRIHGLPLRIVSIPASKEIYVANELDTLVGGPNTVVVLGIWAHFSTFPIQLYICRLQSIRRAVVHLLNRAPGTLVVIRTGNLQSTQLHNVVSNGDWFSIQVDRVLRAMFKGIDVQVVDAWDMVLAHHLPHNLHPKPPIIKNMINVLLSYICPQKKS